MYFLFTTKKGCSIIAFVSNEGVVELVLYTHLLLFLLAMLAIAYRNAATYRYTDINKAVR